MINPREPTMIRLRDGTIRALDENELLPDGATMLASLFMRDQARAGSSDAAFDAEQQRLLGAADAAYADYVHRLQNAWKTPDGPRQAATNDGQRSPTVSTTPITDERLARDIAHRAMIERMTAAWRRP